MYMYVYAKVHVLMSKFCSPHKAEGPCKLEKLEGALLSKLAAQAVSGFK